MSYESRVFRELSLPDKEKLIPILLTALIQHGGAVKEFGSGDQEFSDEIAGELKLTREQRITTMQTLVRKENRIKKFPAWNRLLFRAADLAAKRELLSRPKDTEKLTGKREWMLTEKGMNKALRLASIGTTQKMVLPTTTYEVQKVKKKLFETPKPVRYDPVDEGKKTRRITTESLVRARGFRQAIIESYDYACAICGLRLKSPDFLGWEVQAAHIVPHRALGKDDLWNGIALCRLHHWTFDTGWFTLRADFTLEISRRIDLLPKDQGLIGDYDLLRSMATEGLRLALPKNENHQPHLNSILWHRENVFFST